jgi:hypothetical protein
MSARPRSSYMNLTLDQRGQRRCGVTRMLVNAAGQRRPTWLPCGLLSCDYCGPRLIAERTAHYKVATRYQTTYSHLIDRSQWGRIRKQLYREQAGWVKFDRRGPLLTILCTVQLDQGNPRPVTSMQLEGFLTRQYQALPAGGLVRSCKQWALARAEHEPGEWTVEGVTPMPEHQVLHLARQHGMRVREGIITPPSEQAWQDFRELIGLHQPDHQAGRWWDP